MHHGHIGKLKSPFQETRKNPFCISIKTILGSWALLHCLTNWYFIILYFGKFVYPGLLSVSHSRVRGGHWKRRSRRRLGDERSRMGFSGVGNFQNPLKKSPKFIRACNVLDSENMPLYSTIQNHIFLGGCIRFIVSLKETGRIQNINRYHLPLIVFSAQRR